MADDLREIDTDADRIRANRLLYEIYRDVYARLVAEVPRNQYPRLLELGSGGGFFREFAPHVITSECVLTPRVDRVIDACRIAEAFEPDSLDAIVAFDVFHHLPDAAGFLRGAQTVLRPGGRIVMVEPWYTPVGQLFHTVLHHEPHIKDPNDWRVVGEGRMAGANTRLPTSVFRDSDPRFSREFPALRIVKREPFAQVALPRERRTQAQHARAGLHRAQPRGARPRAAPRRRHLRHLRPHGERR